MFASSLTWADIFKFSRVGAVLNGDVAEQQSGPGDTWRGVVQTKQSEGTHRPFALSTVP